MEIVISIVGVILTLIGLGFYFRHRRADKILREEKEVQEQSAWPEVEVQKKIDWPNKARKSGELEPGDYGWCSADELNEDGREVVKKIDTQRRKVLLYKHGNSLTLVKKDPKQKKK